MAHVLRRARPVLPTLLLLLALVLLAGTSGPAQASGQGRGHARGPVQLTAVGHPTWTPADCHVFSAPVGTAASGYAEFETTTATLLPPPEHVRVEGLGIGPGAPHRPPYTAELADGVGDAGFHEGRSFTPAEFSAGRGVWLACMVVPRPGRLGRSPDFARGRVIPNDLFPIHVSGVSFRNADRFDPNLLDFDVPPLSGELGERFAHVDGHSHFPLFIADNADFGPAGIDLVARYRYDLTLTDTAGNGWHLVARFSIRR